MPSRRPLLLALALVLAAASLLRADGPSTSPHQDSPGFEKLKTLAGHWKGAEEDGSPAWVAYEVASDGHAVKEVLRLGDTATMLSVYHADGAHVRMTHYCLTGAQPRMRTRTVAEAPDELDLVYVDATNVLRARGSLMTGLRLRFLDDDTFEQLWASGVTTEGAVRVRFRRAPAEEVEEALASAPPGDPLPPPRSRAERAFARLVRHAGRWKGHNVGSDWSTQLRFEVVSGGTAFLEQMGLDGTSQMLTVYHLDGNQIMLTHYCSTGTQPRMRTRGIPEDLGSLTFESVDATNVLRSKEAFMKALHIEFDDADHFRQTWNQDTEGRPRVEIENVRVSGGRAEDGKAGGDGRGP